MTVKWNPDFPLATAAVSGDVVVGLLGGTANERFPAESWLFTADNLSDVADAVAAFDNVSPVTTKGDMIYRDASHNVRLAIGTTGQIMNVDATGIPKWINNPGLLIANNLDDVADPVASFDNVSPVTTKGDMIYRDASHNVRLALGSTGEILNVDASGIPAWVANPGLLIANNLDDLADLPTALANLGLSSTDTPTFNLVKVSSANALTAHSGGGQGSALALTKGINRVTTVAADGDSVKLPAATAGSSMVVINAAASNAMDCFPATGEVINALSANTALSIAANKTVIFFCAVNGTWNSVVTA